MYIQYTVYMLRCRMRDSCFILGSIPGPILFGKMIDLTCLLWQKKCDDNDGSCFFYNNQNMSYNLMGIALAGKFLSILFFTLSLVFYKASPKEEEEGAPADTDKETKLNGDSGVRDGQSTNTSVTSLNNGTTQPDVNKNNTGKDFTTKL